MSYDRHVFAADDVIPLRAEDVVPAYCAAPQPASIPAPVAELSPLDQMFAYYDAA